MIRAVEVRMRRNATMPALLFAAGVATAGGLAHAGKPACNDNDAVAALAQAKLGLVQAIGAAQAHVGGKAAKAELECKRGGAVFEGAGVMAKGTVFDVEVDALDGKLLSSKEDDRD
jgi:uncharacterized membrane protein YkoI